MAEKCQPVYGTCLRDAGHTGPHRPLTEEEYRREELRAAKRLIEYEAKKRYCSDPLKIQVFR